MLFFSPVFISLTLLMTPESFAAPAPLDKETMLKNAQAAQVLNTQFRTLKSTDPCTTGQTGCISGALAQCVNDQWQTKQCLASQRCVALPSVREEGTFEACTSLVNALSIMEAAGVQSLFAPNSSNNSTSTSLPAPVQGGASGKNDTASDDGAGAQPIKTVMETVTVTQTLSIAVGETTTMPAETTVLSPAQASRLLSSLVANGASVVTTVTSTPSAAVATVTTTVSVPAPSGGPPDANRAISASAPPSAAVRTNAAAATITLIPAASPNAS